MIYFLALKPNVKSFSFDELLELSHQGNNRVVDMLVGDIYGGIDYSKVLLSIDNTCLFIMHDQSYCLHFRSSLLFIDDDASFLATKPSPSSAL